MIKIVLYKKEIEFIKKVLKDYKEYVLHDVGRNKHYRDYKYVYIHTNKLLDKLEGRS